MAAGASACSSETTGSAARSARPSSPSRASTTTSSARGIRSGSAAPRTRSSATTSRRAALEYLNTELPTGDRVSRRRGRVPAARRADGNARARASAARVAAAMLERFFPNADLAFGVLGTELWSPAGPRARREGVPPPRARRARGVRRRAAADEPRLADRRRSRPSARTACSRRGCCTPGSGPMLRPPGFMTQVIAVAVQEGGMPFPRGGGANLADALVQLIRDHGGSCETGVDVERVLVQTGGRAASARRDGETSTRERAVIANVTPTQLYERLLDAHRRAGRRAEARAASATAAPRCRSTSRSRSPRAGTATSGWTAPRSCTSRPASTASRAPSTRQSAACCPPRRRSSSASR